MGEKGENAKLMHSIDGKEFKELSEISNLSDATELVDIPQNMDWFAHPQEMTFSFTGNISRLALLGIFLDEETLLKYCQSIKSNNWIRRHGLPMIRRVKR